MILKNKKGKPGLLEKMKITNQLEKYIRKVDKNLTENWHKLYSKSLV